MASTTAATEAVDRIHPQIVPRPRGRSLERFVGHILRYTLLILLAAVFLFPFYLIVRNALMTQPEITGFEWKWLPASPQWSIWVS